MKKHSPRSDSHKGLELQPFAQKRGAMSMKRARLAQALMRGSLIPIAMILVMSCGSPATPTPTPTRSPEGIIRRTTSASDAEFLDCSKAVIDGIRSVNDLGVEVVDSGDPATARLLASRAFEILTILDNCREPTDPTLLEAKELLGLGLDDTVTGGAVLADGNPSGYRFLAQGSATINSGLLLLTDYMNAQ